MPKRGKCRKTKNKNDKPIQCIQELDVGIETSEDESRMNIDIEPMDIQDSHDETPTSNDEIIESVEESKIQDSQSDSLNGLQEPNLPDKESGKYLKIDIKDSHEETPSYDDEVCENEEESEIEDSRKDTLNGLQELNFTDEECGKNLAVDIKDSPEKTPSSNDEDSESVEEIKIRDSQKDTLALEEVKFPDRECVKNVAIDFKDPHEETPTSNDEVGENVEGKKIQDSQTDTFNGLEKVNLPDEEYGKSLAMVNENSQEETSISKDKVSEKVEESQIQDSQKDTLNGSEEINLPNEHCGHSLAMDIKDSPKITPSANDEVSESVEEFQIQDSQKDTLTGQSQKNYISITTIDNLTSDQSSKESNNVNGSVSNGPNSGILLGDMKEIVDLYQGAIGNLLKYLSQLKEEDEKHVANGLNNSQEKRPISVEKSSENATEMKELPIQEEVNEDVDMGDNTKIEQTIRNFMKYLKMHLVKTDEVLQKQFQTIKRLTGDNNRSLKNRSQESLEVRITKLEETLRESPFLVTTLVESLQNMNMRTYELEQTLHMSQKSVISLEDTLQKADARVTDLEETLQMSKAQVPELQKTLQTYQTRVCELEGMLQMEKTNITSLEEMLRTSEAHITEKDKMMQMSEAHVTELEGKLQMSEARVTEVERVLKQTQMHVTGLEEKLQESQAQITKFKGILDESEARVSELKGTLHLSGAHVTELERKLQQSVARATVSEGMLLIAQERVSDLEEKTKYDKSRIIELKEEVKMLEACRENLEQTLHKSPVPLQEKRRYERNSMHDVKRYTPERNKRKHYLEDRDSAAEN